MPCACALSNLRSSCPVLILNTYVLPAHSSEQEAQDDIQTLQHCGKNLPTKVPAKLASQLSWCTTLQTHLRIYMADAPCKTESILYHASCCCCRQTRMPKFLVLPAPLSHQQNGNIAALPSWCQTLKVLTAAA